MFTLEDVRNEYRRLDALCGVDTSHIKLKVSKKGVSRFGFCRGVYGRDGRVSPVEISLSDMIFEDDSLFWQTIRHEYAHALVSLRDGNPHGHDWTWKRACREIGCDPKRLIDTRMSEVVKQREAERAKYILCCRNCGWERLYYRKGKVINRLCADPNCSDFWCPHCGPKEGKLRLLTKEDFVNV